MVLRVGIGLHFYLEGATKLHDPKPFSAGFLGSAKGPFAPNYKRMVWDADGLFRFNYDATARHGTTIGIASWPTTDLTSSNLLRPKATR